jgi:hypothetical protein
MASMAHHRAMHLYVMIVLPTIEVLSLVSLECVFTKEKGLSIYLIVDAEFRLQGICDAFKIEYAMLYIHVLDSIDYKVMFR